MPFELDARKLFAGARIRRLRAEHGLTQTAMAERLGVSISYLNLIERNQRPLTANVLLRLANAFDLDVRALLESERHVTEESLAEVLSDPALAAYPVARSEIQDLIANAPNAAQVLEMLYALYRQERQRAEAGGGQEMPRGGIDIEVERLRDFLAERRNHFPELDALAERIHDEMAAPAGQLAAALIERLQSRHRIRARILPAHVMGVFLRKFDPHRRNLNLSELLQPASRQFQLAFQIGVLEADAAVRALIAASPLNREPVGRMLRLTLLNYFAAALVMPYGRFFRAVEELGYDIERIGRRFEASVEQVCHRLTTLQRAKSRGIAFSMIRIDAAGNVSKRLASGPFPIARYGGTCALWNVHQAFAAPGRILVQLIEMPEGARYFSVARAADRLAGGAGVAHGTFALALVCEASAAERMVYARGLDLKNGPATPVGLSCRLCPRAACAQRSAPPLDKESRDSDFEKTLAPFGF